MKDDCKIYLLSGSCCEIEIENPNILVKKIKECVSGVDNGYKKFFYEIKHIRDESKMFPDLYPIIYEIDDSNNEYSVKFEFCYRGMTLADLLRNEAYDEQYFEKSLEFILDKLFREYYSIPRNSKPKEDYIIYCYPERIEQRMRVLETEQFKKDYGCSHTILKMMKHGVCINNQYYPSIYDYTGYIRQDKELQQRLMIHKNTYSHHDLIPANIVVDASGNLEHISQFRLIDPRGETETGINIRNYMYDMGKLLIGTDTLDIFRIFNGKIENSLYTLKCTKEIDGILHFDLGFDIYHPIIKKYMNASNSFHKIMKKNNYYCEYIGESEDDLQIKYLFSFANMFHPDIPCRIIFEREDTIPIAMYLRGLMIYRTFMDSYYGMDPLRHVENKQEVDLWPYMVH